MASTTSIINQKEKCSVQFDMSSLEDQKNKKVTKNIGLPFPEKLKNKCGQRPDKFVFERILDPNNSDRRYLYHNPIPEVALLRLLFSGDQFYIGTGTLLKDAPSAVLTAAHNVIEFDYTTDEPNNADCVWIELPNGDTAMATGWYILSDYIKDHNPGSGNDLAVIFFPVEIINLFDNPSNAKVWTDKDELLDQKMTKISVVGYPGEKNYQISR